jgi:hypothetical protein
MDYYQIKYFNTMSKNNSIQIYRFVNIKSNYMSNFIFMYKLLNLLD